VLTISNDGKLVVVADTVSTPSQVYIYDASSTTATPVDLIIPGETVKAAAFSPDQLKLFILTTTGKMYVYSTVDAFSSVPIATTATDVKFSADGSFAYVAGTPASAVSAFSTCSLPTIASVDIGNVAASTTPLEIFPSPVVQADSQGLTQNLLALEPPNIEFLTAEQFTQVPIPYQVPLQLTCNPPTIASFSKGASFNLGQGNFTPIYAQFVADGTAMIIVANNIPAVLIFDVSSGTTTSIPLANGSLPISASASTDGSQVYVAASDPCLPGSLTCPAGSVHIVCATSCTTGQGDFQQVPYVNINDNNNPNMCNGQGTNAPVCLPNLIAIRPQ
jgi:DNA-binding beta-propeller fold protein YncE